MRNDAGVKRAAAKPVAMTTILLAVLRVFLRCPDICRYQMEVAAAVGVYPATAGDVMRRLVKAGWLERLPVVVKADLRNGWIHSDDRTHYRLTPDGAKLARDMVDAYDANPGDYVKVSRWELMPRAEWEGIQRQRQSGHDPTIRRIIIHGEERQYRMTPTGDGTYLVTMEGVKPFSVRSTGEARSRLFKIHGPKRDPEVSPS